MIFKLASNITVKTFEFHYFNKFAKKSNQHQQKTEGIFSLALIVHPVKDKRKEKARMVTRCCCCCCCCCCWGHPGPSQVACWAQGSLSSGGCMRCLCLWVFSGACLEGENDSVSAWGATCIKVWQLMTRWKVGVCDLLVERKRIRPGEPSWCL